MSSETRQTNTLSQNLPQAWLVGAISWAVPGLGHIWLGRNSRGLVIGATVIFMFLSGLWLGGHLHGLHNTPDIGMLAYVYGFCNLGLGLIYLVCFFANIGLADQAALATAEYGNVFLIVAGLLNYLSMLDAFDLAAGRKS
ncbi:MAG: hypothetical protein H7Z38_21140 [Rubrivivax sp.]|nr:hypothetical protein [Pyrinomonadaceae bacterium]